jgi:poly(3-hydroxybutyrate) depolymerase
MIYRAYEWQRRLTEPARITSELMTRALDGLPAPLTGLPVTRRVRAACEIMASARPTHLRPDWEIDSTVVDGEVTEVEVRPVLETPFATVEHFAKATVSSQPQVLVVGPMSGHFATLLRPTVRTLLADHDVYVIDWHNARDIPATEGRFGLDEYVDHVLGALRQLGPDTHVLAVCQPAPLVLAAVAILAAAGDVAQPSSLTLIAGPIDTRINPSRINTAAERRPLSFYQRFLTTTVPSRYAGAGREVYPGVAQLAAFMSMNGGRHVNAYANRYRALVAGDAVAAARIGDFYDEYGAVMDVPAEFYLETLERVFLEHHLPRGIFTWRGTVVDPSAIEHTALLTIEGIEDDMCPPGQTEAAHRLCTGIPHERRRHHVQEGVGHYGVFAGSRWENDIYPVVRRFIADQQTARRVATVS